MRKRPPRLAEMLVSASLDGAYRDAVLGDLREEFMGRLASEGPRSARRWYWRQVCGSLWPNLRRRLGNGAPNPPPGPGGSTLLSGGLGLDFRYALRSLRASAGLTSVALIILTLGVGATTAVFSVVDAVIFRPLPYAAPDRLVVLRQDMPGFARALRLSSAAPVTSQDFVDWTARQDVFAGLAAWVSGGVPGSVDQSGSEPEAVHVARVTASFFSVLGVAPALGVTLNSERAAADNPHLGVISDTYWRRRFGADPGVVGRTLVLDNGSWQIVGVMPPGFDAPSDSAFSIGSIDAVDMWVPYVMTPDERSRTQDHNNHLETVARLKPTVTLQQAQARMTQISTSLAHAYPAWYNHGGQALVLDLATWETGAPVRSWMLMLWGAVLCVFLVACANVANLLLARATSRSREVGVRAALGASQWRLFRELLVEGALLSSTGAVLAVIGANWIVRLLRSALPSTVPHAASIGLNLRVLGMAFGASVLTALCFGIVPALSFSRTGMMAALREGGRSGTASRGRQWLRGGLVVIEVGFAVVLVVGAALFTASFVKLMRVNEGFDYHNVVAVHAFPQESGTTAADRQPEGVQILEELAAQMRASPGVESAGVLAGALPFTGEQHRSALTVPGRSEPLSTNDFPDLYYVSPEYLRTMHIPLIRGRTFSTTDDRVDSGPVVILNQTAATRYFGSEDPLGQYVVVPADRTSMPRLVVGVVEDIRPLGPETATVPQAYCPLSQGPYGNGYVVIRTTKDPSELLPLVKTRISATMPKRVMPTPQLLDKLFGGLVAQRRFNMVLVGMFGLLALAIATTGVYGVIAYVVEQRTQEIGVRIALGARSSQVIRLVLGRALVLLTAGLVLGGQLAWSSSSVISAFLFEVSAHDATVFGAVSPVLLLVGLVAAYFPARRAALVDPLIALRQE